MAGPAMSEGVRPLAEVIRDGSVVEKRRALATWLEVRDEIGVDVLAALLTHPDYARQLAVARGHPEAVDWLLAHPPEVPPSAGRLLGLDETHQTAGAVTLVSQAAKSLGRWTAGGLRRVDDGVRERRWSACLACPHLVAPPARGVYRAITVVMPDAKICGLCGCVAAAKVRLPHEHCPDRHPDDPQLTRWDEPRPGAARPDVPGPQPAR